MTELDQVFQEISRKTEALAAIIGSSGSRERERGDSKEKSEFRTAVLEIPRVFKKIRFATKHHNQFSDEFGSIGEALVRIHDDDSKSRQFYEAAKLSYQMLHQYANWLLRESLRIQTGENNSVDDDDRVFVKWFQEAVYAYLNLINYGDDTIKVRFQLANELSWLASIGPLASTMGRVPPTRSRQIWTAEQYIKRWDTELRENPDSATAKKDAVIAQTLKKRLSPSDLAVGGRSVHQYRY